MTKPTAPSPPASSQPPGTGAPGHQQVSEIASINEAPGVAETKGTNSSSDCTTTLHDSEPREVVLVSSSYPSQISLKFQVIMETMKSLGCMDIDCLNLAIRKMMREVSNDGNSKNHKHYVSADFARYAISKKDRDMETCIHDEFLDLHNGSNPDAYPEVLCIPVIHDGHWTLYAFNMNNHKLSILDPNLEEDFNVNHKRHKAIRLKVCKALEFTKTKFNVFKSHDFRSWIYEFPKVPQQKSSYDSGFLVFNFMLQWDGQHCPDFSNESEQLRTNFIQYILSFKDNEALQLSPHVAQLIEKLSLGTAWTRSLMDSGLLKAVREGDAEELQKLFTTESVAREKAVPLKSVFLQGVTSDGDGVLHIAARFGRKNLVEDIIGKLLPEGQASDNGNRREVRLRFSIEDDEGAVQILTARNHRGETCLHEAVRWGRKDLVKLLVSAKTLTSPPLVQVVDYQGVSPLYLATTIRRADIVKVLIAEDNCSYGGPGGKTALHAAVLLNKELSDLLLKKKPDLAATADRSGSTPLHLLASAGGAAIAKLLLPAPKASAGGAAPEEDAKNSSSSEDGKGSSPEEHAQESSSSSDGKGSSSSKDAKKASPKEDADKGRPRDKHSDPDGSCSAVLKKDSKGRLPIHVAAANGRVDIIKKLIKACHECMSSRNASGQTFLHVAVDMTRHNVVRYVCKQPQLEEVLNLRDQDGNTALHLAVKSGNQCMFCILMSNKRVCLSVPNREGRTPRDLSVLGMDPGLKLLQNSRVLTRIHLRLAGADFGTCPRDELTVARAGKLDKDKLSETISKSAGIMAVCAVFMLNISITAFFNVAKQYAPPTVPDEGASKSERARRSAYKALMIFDVIAFASSALAAFCSTYAGFPAVDRPTRYAYLLIGGVSLQIASLAVVAVFILTAYLALALVDLWIAIVACVLPLAAIAPQFAPVVSMLLHSWSLLHRLIFFDAIRLFQHATRLFQEKFVSFFQDHVSPGFVSFGTMVNEKVTTSLLRKYFVCNQTHEGSCLWKIKLGRKIKKFFAVLWRHVLFVPTIGTAIFAAVICAAPIVIGLAAIALAVGLVVAIVGGLIYILVR